MSRRQEDLASPYLSALIPYAPGKPIEEVERECGISDSVTLASNENPLGPWRGVIVRPVGGCGFPARLRIAIGTAKENEECVATLKAKLEA